MKTFVLAGGYTIRHLFLKLLEHRVLPQKSRVELFLSNHFTENVHPCFSTIKWGQNYQEFPDEGKKFLGHRGGSLDISHIKTFNANTMEHFEGLSDVVVHPYEPGALKISKLENGFEVMKSQLRSSHDNIHQYSHQNSHLIYCLCKPSSHWDAKYNSLDTVEDFLEQDIYAHNLPIIIFGDGASAMWVAEVCMDLKRDFIFADAEQPVLKAKFENHIRNATTYARIMEKNLKKPVFRSDDCSITTFGQFQKLEDEDYETRIFKREVDNQWAENPNLAPEKTVIISKIDDYSEVQVGRAVLCIGFDAEFVDDLAEITSVSSLAVNANATSPLAQKIKDASRKHTIGLSSMQNSVQVQLAYGWQVMGEHLELNSGEKVEGIDLHKLFLLHCEQDLLQEFLNEKHEILFKEDYFGRLKTKVDKLLKIPEGKEEAISVLSQIMFSENYKKKAFQDLKHSFRNSQQQYHSLERAEEINEMRVKFEAALREIMKRRS